MLGEALDVGESVVEVGAVQPLEPARSGRGVRRTAGNDRRQLVDGVMDGGADGARRAVDLLERRRDLLEEQYRALGGDEGVGARHLLDLAHRLLQPPDGGLRPPAEGVASESGPKGPGMGRLPHHHSSPVRSPAGIACDRGAAGTVTHADRAGIIELHLPGKLVIQVLTRAAVGRADRDEVGRGRTRVAALVLKLYRLENPAGRPALGPQPGSGGDVLTGTLLLVCADRDAEAAQLEDGAEPVHPEPPGVTPDQVPTTVPPDPSDGGRRGEAGLPGHAFSARAANSQALLPSREAHRATIVTHSLGPGNGTAWPPKTQPV